MNTIDDGPRARFDQLFGELLLALGEQAELRTRGAPAEALYENTGRLEAIRSQLAEVRQLMETAGASAGTSIRRWDEGWR